MKRCLAMAVVFVPQFLFAQQLTGITANSEAVAVNETVKLSVQLKVARDLVWCGLRVDFGDGETRDIRVEDNPLLLTKAYAAPGNYTVRADGKGIFRGLKSAVPCLGDAQAILIVVANPAAESDRQRKERADRAVEDLTRREHELVLREKAFKEKAATELKPDDSPRPASAPAKKKPIGAATNPKAIPSSPSASASKNRDDSWKVFK